jgi:phosphatidylglycerol lysyltransferase
MGFLVQPEGLTASDDARGFLARQGDRLVGFAIAVPIFARRGWLLQHLVRDPDAPNGTAELLVDRLMRAAAGEGAELATMGLAPLSGDVHPWLRLARGLGARLYNFEGLRAFKAKLRPRRWDPIYLSYPVPPASIARPFSMRGALAIHDVLAAFARGAFLRFAFQALRLRAARAVRLSPAGRTAPALTGATRPGERPPPAEPAICLQVPA